MTQVVGTLEIQLLSDLARLQTDMDNAKRAVGNAMSAVDRSVAQAAQAMADYTTQSKMTTNGAISDAAKQASAVRNAMAEEAHYADLKKQWAAHNKKLADDEIADTKRKADALAAFHAEAQNAELNLKHTGRGKSSAMLEDKYTRLGFSPAEINTQLAGLRKIEAANAAAFAAANPHIAKLTKDAMAAGTSVKGLSASLRNVPAQFTDIFVSLQGGQAPLTVLLQQGGQLKDMFGGVGGAFRALGGYVLGLINPFTIAAAVVTGFGVAMNSINNRDGALLTLSTQLTGTGRASVAATGDIKELVKELNNVPGVSKSAATSILGEFAKVQGLGGEMFRSLGSSVADFAAATGTDLPTAAKKLATSFADPAKGARELDDALGTLTAAQILSIEKMAMMGDKAGAQAALMDALKTATQGLANQGMTPLGQATETFSNAWDNMLTKVGNSDGLRTANSMIATIITTAANAATALANMKLPAWMEKGFSFNRSIYEAFGGNKPTVAPEGSWNMGGSTGSFSPSQTETEKQIKAALDATKSYTSQKEAMTKLKAVAGQTKAALSELALQNRSDSIEAVTLRERLVGVNEKIAEQAKRMAGKPGKVSDAEKGLKLYNDLMDKSVGLTANFAEQQGLLMAKFAKDDNLAQYQDAMSALIAQQPYMTDAIKAEEEALKAADKARKDSIDAIEKARNSSILSHAKEIESLNDKTQKLEDEVAMYGLSKSAIEELTTARMLDRIEILKGFENSAEAIAMIEAEIAARRRLAAAGTAKDDRDAVDKNDKKIEAESKKAAETLHNDVKGALAAAFRDTKDPIVAFGDALGNIVFTRLSNAVADAMATQLVGNGSTGSSGLLSGFMSLFSYAGGGYTGDGSRSGGVDGQGGFLSVLHPQETVIDHTRNTPMEKSGSKGDTFIINISANVGDIASKTDVVNGMRATAAQIKSEIIRSRTHGGAMA